MDDLLDCYEQLFAYEMVRESIIEDIDSLQLSPRTLDKVACADYSQNDYDEETVTDSAPMLLSPATTSFGATPRGVIAPNAEGTFDISPEQEEVEDEVEAAIDSDLLPPRPELVPEVEEDIAVEEEKISSPKKTAAADKEVGFLLSFLVASGVDVARAIRVAARLRSVNVCGPTQLARMKKSSLREMGLRVVEVSKIIKTSRVVATEEDVRLPRVRNPRRSGKQKRVGSQKPRMDPTTWAKERRARILSARRRQKIRLTE